MTDLSVPAGGADPRIERLESLYYGKYRGIVTHNADPEQLGRLRLLVPSLFGGTFADGAASDDNLVTDWAWPCVPAGGAANQGELYIPEVGAKVWVEFEEGNLDCPIWVGTFWAKPGGQSELPKPNGPDGAELDAVQGSDTEPPTRKIIKTKKGHTIQLEDKDGEELILIVHKVDEDNCNVVLLNADGIAITDFSQNKIEMTASGITLTDLTGNEIVMSDSEFKLTAKVAFAIDASGQAVEIKASTVDFTKA
jgi:small nuclear ribonucleoprotein (snRNP)-like protein